MRGRPTPEAEKRKHLVACRLTDDEAARVDRLRGAITRGEWLRRAALSKPPRTIPEINRQAWLELAKLAGNLNQLARAVNEGRADIPEADIKSLRELVQQLRLELIGAKQ